MKLVHGDRFEAYLDGWTNVLMVTADDCQIYTLEDEDSPVVRYRDACWQARDRELYLDLFGCLDAPL